MCQGCLVYEAYVCILSEKTMAGRISFETRYPFVREASTRELRCFFFVCYKSRSKYTR